MVVGALQSEQSLDLVVEGDHDHRDEQHHETGFVGNLRSRPEARLAMGRHRLRHRMDILPEPEQGDQERTHQRDERNRRGAHEELRERETGLVADEDSHGVSKHRRRRADVGGHHSDEHERMRPELQRFANLEHEREHDDDGRHFIDHRCHHRRQHAEDRGERHARHLVPADDDLDDPREEAQVLQYAHDDHHAHEEQDDVELRACEHLPERHRLAPYEQGHADERDAHATFPEEERCGDDGREHRERKRLRDVRREACLKPAECHAAYDEKLKYELRVEKLFHDVRSLPEDLVEEFRELDHANKAVSFADVALGAFVPHHLACDLHGGTVG